MIDMSEQIGELSAALSKVQAQIKPAVMNASNPFFKSRYADLASVWDACRELLAASGLAVIQPMAEAPAGHVAVDTILTHTSGQWVRGRLTMPLTKADPQAAGSAITYARRYSLAAIVGIVADEDDDANGATHGSTKPERHDNATGGGVSSPDRPTAAGRSPAPPPAPGGPIPIPPPCPVCGGDMWDNRDKRQEAEAEIASGARTKKAPPAWKCRDKECKGVIWPSDPNEPKAPKDAQTTPLDTGGDSPDKAKAFYEAARKALNDYLVKLGIPTTGRAAKVKALLANEYNSLPLDKLPIEDLKAIAAGSYEDVDWEACRFKTHEETPF